MTGKERIARRIAREFKDGFYVNRVVVGAVYRKPIESKFIQSGGAA